MNPILKPLSVVLKEARKNKGRTLEEVHKATKIHPHILRSLEEGTILQLSEVYVKSYTKIYAKYLGISDQELSQYFRSPIDKERKDRRSPRDLFAKTKKEEVKNIIVGASRFQFRTLLERCVVQRKKIFVICGGVLIVFFLVRLGSCGRQKSAVIPVKTRPVPVQKKSPVSTPKTATQIKQTPKPEPPAAVLPKPAVAPSEDALRLTIVAEEDAWLQVIQDNAVVFRGTLEKSASETWKAKDRFELRLNNAGAVRLELNGKILSPIGRKGQQLRKVVITKDGGLKIER